LGLEFGREKPTGDYRAGSRASASKITGFRTANKVPSATPRTGGGLDMVEGKSFDPFHWAVLQSMILSTAPAGKETQGGTAGQERPANMSETDFQEKYSIYPRFILCLSAISDATDILDRLHEMIYI
jgi:hypothetical protein